MKTLIKISVYFLIILFFFNSCKNQRALKDIIKIGASIDLTGPNSVYGKQVKEGVDIAVDYINDSLNNGKDVVVVKYLDSKDMSREAISNLNIFLSLDKINIIIGGVSSNVVKSMIPVIESNRAFLFAPASSGSILTNVSKNFARNWPSDDLEAGFAAKYVIEKLKSKHVLVISVNNYYGEGLRVRFINELKKSGILQIDTILYEVDQSDYKTIIGQVRDKHPDCIYLAGNPKEMGRFMKQMKEQNLKYDVVSNTGFLQPDCLNIAKAAANGVVVPTPKPSDDSKDIKSIKLFNDLYNNNYHTSPTLVTANSFDAVMLIYEAIRKNGNDPLMVAKYIRNLKGFNGASGYVDFTDGEISTDITFLKIVNNEPVVISF